MAHVINACLQGLKTLSFTSMREFLYWKEREEEATYSSYTKGQQTYNPSSSGRCTKGSNKSVFLFVRDE